MSLIKSPRINNNYGAQIIVVKGLKQVPNSDFLKCFSHQGCNIISSTVEEGDRVVYFPVESRLDNVLLAKNNLFRKSEHNVDKEVVGFFELTGRVRAIKLRGSYSEGFVLPLQALVDAYPGLVTLEELQNLSSSDLGVPFDAVGSGGKMQIICSKYVRERDETKLAAKNMKRGKKIERVSRMVEDQFALHRDTPKLAYVIGDIPYAAKITVTEKLHGTSFVSSNVLVKRKLSWIDKIAKFLKATIQETVYGNVYSSRKVIKNEFFEPKVHNHYYKEDIWGRANNHLKDKLLAGETVYGEIVGYTGDNAMIQKGFDYGCELGTYAIYIYRITQTTPKGEVIEMGYDYISARATQLGVSAVPLLFKGTWLELLHEISPNRTNLNKETVLELLKNKYANGKNCKLCSNKVPAEGSCFTVETGTTSKTYKLKSSAFLQYETKQLDTNEINIEDGE